MTGFMSKLILGKGAGGDLSIVIGEKKALGLSLKAIIEELRGLNS